MQRHYIITANGVSKQAYGTPKENPHHGIGQGSTEAPIIWLLISSILLTSIKTWAQGVVWEAPDQSTHTHRIADVYVDDTTLWVKNIEKIPDLIKKMATDLQKYQEMLRWTGGALTLHKCFFCTVIWAFTPEGLPYLVDEPHTLEIKRGPMEAKEITEIKKNTKATSKVTSIQLHWLGELTGQKLKQDDLEVVEKITRICLDKVQIQQKQSDTVQKSLGLHMTIGGCTKGPEEIFATQNKKYGIRILKSRIQPLEVRMAHKMVHLPSQ